MDVSDRSLGQTERTALNGTDSASEAGTAYEKRQRRIRNIIELEKSACRTRMSHRHILIRTRTDDSGEMLRDPVRLYVGTEKSVGAGRVVDWD